MPRSGGIGGVTIILRGHIPAKKNNWRFWKGSVIVDRGQQALMDPLVLSAMSQWRRNGQQLAPIERPAINATFHVRDGRGDLDNKWTTVQDLLVQAGVLPNDSIARLPGPITLRAFIDPDERVEITIMERKE